MLQLVLTYSAVATVLVYLVLIVLRRHLQVSALGLVVAFLAAVVIEVCDTQILLNPQLLLRWKQVCLVAEACLPVGLLLFCLTYARRLKFNRTSIIAWLLFAGACCLPVAAIALSASALMYSPDFETEKILFLRPAGYWFYVALMTTLVVALCYLERTYVALERSDRWRVKFEVVGAGLIIAVLVIYYSQALLYRSLDMNLVPVRTGSLIVGVLLMGYSRRYRGVLVALQVSRHVAYRSIVILAVGFYLIVLGLFGTGMQYLDLSQNRSLMLGAAVVTGLLLVVLLLSETVRRRIQVTLHKNFYQKKYDYRSEWLQFTSRLAQAKNRTELEAAILTFYAETFSVRGAALFLREREDGAFGCCAQYEMELHGLKLAGQFPQEHPHDCSWVTNLTAQHEELDGAWQALHKHGCSFLIPLCFDSGIEGFIALGQRVYAGEDLTYEDFDLMKILAHQAIGVLLSRKLYTDLIAAKEMAAIGKISTFVIHDLKNQVSSLGLVVDNARDYIDDHEFRSDMFETLDNTVANMNSLIIRLQNIKRQPQLQLRETDLFVRAQRAVQQAANPVITLAGESVQVCADDTELEQVLLNLLHNAREASAANQPISVTVGHDAQAYVRVQDHGCGMSADFIRTRLFIPFESTKKKGTGIGLYQCRQVVESHGGRIEVESTPEQGTTFTLWLPIAEQLAPK
ncbi:XrtA/PEP-CTERM system histidine kinase PrsK [Syntrophotalea acetylenica]|uniref:XrtA/PEP-CTERM system histidine kinase PrsK n=1 Tax=Syntrophotalea acetylenica TaxID=29542 RepID=UPI002A35D80F|nr:XrtA/PEP-CTERM system histidine kinase PrsK [Syntrophotalea acetylenica]MDY0263352.1 PEP-CTERM system histidine kinase PrsK [Syntrophotalea acetylenica]